MFASIDIPLSVVAITGIVNTIMLVLTYLKTHQIKEQTDGLTTKLVAVTRSDALQEGMAKGVEIGIEKEKNGH